MSQPGEKATCSGPKKCGRPKKPANLPDIEVELDDDDVGPFVSDAVKDQLKIVRKSMKRLEREQCTLTEIKELLYKVMKELDNDIEMVRRMKDIADWASQFQSEGYYPMYSDEEKEEEEEVESPST